MRHIVILAIAVVLGVGGLARAGEYPREDIYDTRVFADDAAVNVSLVNARWPDCTTLESAIADIFRIEGVTDGADPAKAQALWKWFRILVSSTGGGYVYEGPPGKRSAIVYDPAKIFAVYGHHQCDGLSWAMAPLWRAAGYMAFDECTHGHTTAALRYRDEDGVLRYHSFDLQARCYYWYTKLKRVGTRSVPVMRGMVYRHLTAPQRLHNLRTSLRLGETVVRKWDNTGHIVPHGKDKLKSEATKYYAYRPGRTDGVYAAVGEEVQTLEASTDPALFAGQLCAGSGNAACSASGGVRLHPREAGRTAAFVYRLAPPFVIADAKVEASLVKGAPGDACRLLFSTDGTRWHAVFEKQKVGEEKVEFNIGKAAWKAGRPHAYTAYNLLVKAEFRTADEASRVGMNGLKVTVHRQLNKRTLPNLRPGENWLRLTAEKLAAGQALELELAYRVKGKAFRETRKVASFPYYFKVDVAGAGEFVLGNYDKSFNVGDVQMDYFRMRLVPAAAAAGSAPSLPEARGRAQFAASYPHPAKMINLKADRRPEPADDREVSGFLPQGDPKPAGDAEAMKKLLAGLKGNREKDWRAVEDLGDYPEAVGALLAALPRANIDQTLVICKALAKLKPREAVGPLLAKWKKGQAGTPGVRYIPDTLAAIGDRSVVPQLVAPLKKVRFDIRLHVARALGILGGPEAEKALKDLAKNDPFLGVREEAGRALQKLGKSGKK